MHAETLAYLFHNLDYNRKVAVREEHASGAAPANQMIDIPTGAAILGQSKDCFGWDNEFPRHSIQVPRFSVSKYKITNGEYLRFVEAGAAAPHFWTQQSGR